MQIKSILMGTVAAAMLTACGGGDKKSSSVEIDTLKTTYTQAGFQVEEKYLTYTYEGSSVTFNEVDANSAHALKALIVQGENGFMIATAAEAILEEAEQNDAGSPLFLQQNSAVASHYAFINHNDDEEEPVASYQKAIQSSLDNLTFNLANLTIATAISGDSITPVTIALFRGENAPEMSGVHLVDANGNTILAPSLAISEDRENHTVTISGVMPEDIEGVYRFVIQVDTVHMVINHSFTVNAPSLNNTPASFSGDLALTAAEDSGKTYRGTVKVNDLDGPSEEAMKPYTNYKTKYGTFDMDASGDYTYELDDANPTVDALNDGETLQERIIIEAIDGTKSAVTVTIEGNTDVAPDSPTDFSGVTKFEAFGTYGLEGEVFDADGIESMRIDYSNGDFNIYPNGNIDSEGTHAPGTTYTITVVDSNGVTTTHSGIL